MIDICTCCRRCPIAQARSWPAEPAARQDVSLATSQAGTTASWGRTRHALSMANSRLGERWSWPGQKKETMRGLLLGSSASSPESSLLPLASLYATNPPAQTTAPQTWLSQWPSPSCSRWAVTGDNLLAAAWAATEEGLHQQVMRSSHQEMLGPAYPPPSLPASAPAAGGALRCALCSCSAPSGPSGRSACLLSSAAADESSRAWAPRLPASADCTALRDGGTHPAPSPSV